MKRRTFLAAAAATTLARPAIAAGTKPLLFVPQANLTSLDPVWTTATVTRNFAFMVYETLYGRDKAFVPAPADGRRPRHRRRRQALDDEAARRCCCHDGTPVLARDCIASLQRWLKRDQSAPRSTPACRRDRGAGRPHAGLAPEQAVPAAAAFPVEGAAAAGDHAGAPGRHRSVQAGDRDRRLRPVPLSADEYVSGSFAAFARFDRYKPRQEPASYAAGGHHVRAGSRRMAGHSGRATAANALTAGEVDWLELPQPDLIAMLKKQPGVTTGLLDIYGTVGVLRPNHIHGPTSNAGRAARHGGGDQPEGGDDRRDGRGPGDPGARRWVISCPVRNLPTTPAWTRCASSAAWTRSRGCWTKAGYDGETHRLHASDRPAGLQRASDRGGRCVPQGRAERRRADDGLGHDRAAAHLEGAARQGRLVDVSRRRAGPEIRRSAAGRTRCAATAPRRGSAGRTIRSWRRSTRRGSTHPTMPNAAPLESRSRRRRSRRCQPSRWGSICRTRRGDRISPGW